MYLVVLYIFIRWKGRVTIIVTITFLRISARMKFIICLMVLAVCAEALPRNRVKRSALHYTLNYVL